MDTALLSPRQKLTEIRRLTLRKKVKRTLFLFASPTHTPEYEVGDKNRERQRKIATTDPLMVN